MKGQRIVQAEGATNRRYAPRTVLRVMSQGADQSTSFEVCIQTISITGISIESPHELKVGSRVEIVLPGTGPASATVKWSEGMISGCQFDAPISQGAVSAVRLKGYPVTREADAATGQYRTALLGSDEHRLPGAQCLAVLVVTPLAAWALVAGVLSFLI